MSLSKPVFKVVKSKYCVTTYNGLNLNVYRQGSINPVNNDWFESLELRYDRRHNNWKVVKPVGCDNKTWSRIQGWAEKTIEDLDTKYKVFLEQKALELDWDFTSSSATELHHSYWQHFEESKQKSIPGSPSSPMEVVSLSSSSFSVSSLDSIPMADSISSLVSEDEDEDEDDQMDLQELNERQAKEQAYQRVRQRALSKIVFAPLCWDQSKYVPAKNWSDITDEAIKAGEHIDPGSFSRILDQVLDILGIQEPVDYLEVIKNRKFQVQLDLALEKFRFNYGNGSSRELFTIYEGVENK